MSGRELENRLVANNNRIEIAKRWTTALSSTGVKPLKALEEVLDNNVRTTNLTSKAAVLNWFKTSPSKPMFRTGTWQKPTVSGDVVTFVSQFHPKAAYHNAKVSITVGKSGLITEATVLILAAPDPLGTVINRVWGQRAGIDRLPDHLAEAYGVKVKTIKQLDNGVFHVNLAKGGPWIVRVFPSDRPIKDVEGDATVLRFLESKNYPAEHCAANVSVHDGQGVLVTNLIEGPKPNPGTDIERQFGDLLGRLHSLTGAPKAVRREAGGLHLYTVDGTVGSEIETARTSLEAAAFRGTDKAWDTLSAGFGEARDFRSLPKVLIHPDPGCANAIFTAGELVAIDWGGAGYRES